MLNDNKLSQEQILEFDIRRTIILGLYMKEWSMPEYRVIMSKPEIGVYIELYYFPANNHNTVARFATIGLSKAIQQTSKKLIQSEWMLALRGDLGQASIDRVYTYLADLLSHQIETVASTTMPQVMSESTLAPESWTAKAILLDELRGESDELESIKIGDELINVRWVVPITADEVQLILDKGIDAFDDYMERQEHSIVDPVR